MSRCSSPIPLRMVWPDSWSVETRKDGSSATSFCKRDAELLLIGLGFRLDRDLDDRIGEFHLLEDHGLLHVAQRVAGARVLQAGERHDVAREGFLDVLAVVGVHEQHAPDALASCPSSS